MLGNSGIAETGVAEAQSSGLERLITAVVGLSSSVVGLAGYVRRYIAALTIGRWMSRDITLTRRAIAGAEAAIWRGVFLRIVTPVIISAASVALAHRIRSASAAIMTSATRFRSFFERGQANVTANPTISRSVMRRLVAVISGIEAVIGRGVFLHIVTPVIISAASIALAHRIRSASAAIVTGATRFRSFFKRGQAIVAADSTISRSVMRRLAGVVSVTVTNTRDCIKRITAQVFLVGTKKISILLILTATLGIITKARRSMMGTLLALAAKTSIYMTRGRASLFGVLGRGK